MNRPRPSVETRMPAARRHPAQATLLQLATLAAVEGLFVDDLGVSHGVASGR